MTSGPKCGFLRGMEKTYQMLWDCTYCGQKKLLGLSHRFCPNCGAPQNAALRYYPSDAEKVAVEDHQYSGADLRCPACANFVSRRANNCGNCGGSMQGGKEVATREAQVAAQGAHFQGETANDARRVFGAPGTPPAPPQGAPMAPAKRSSAGCVIGILVAVIFGMGMIGIFCWKKSGSFEVTGQSWERRIAVETFGPVRSSAWCDEVPSGANVLDRTKEKRSTRKVQDGQECHNVRKDMGDGTFKEKQECQPKYKDEPVYGDRCTYEQNQWKKTREAESKGESASPAPSWPSAGIARPGSCVGCEREGARDETYTVRLQDAKGKDAGTCTFPQSKWESFTPGSRWEGLQSVVTGSADCGSLKQK